ncbi:neuronal PAS domain-containing protein 4 isoform X4 [Anas acuta]|uniref:neuronal PAS domain-containing protein 4 isoform X4 n=1 Tax=Anas acuta TaxID=28680 RepID=UPI0035C8C9C8
MTIFCSHCHRPLQAQASCLPSRAGAAPGVSKPFRSTKSASKARRDQINAELQALRSLLPISAREKERLSYLHTMALVCLRLRGAHLFPPGTPGHRCTCPAPRQHSSARGAAPAGASHCAPPAVSAPPAGPVLAAELLSLLPGFLLVLSAAGKLVYISENVSQVLGLSMVELLAQGDTVFDILEGRAREEVCKKLLLAQEQPGRGKAGRTGGCWAGVLQELPCLGALWLPGRGAGPPREPLTQSCFAAEVTFVSEMRTSKAFRLQHGGNRAVAVRGHFMAPRWPAPPSATAFLALCTPVPPLAAEGDAGSQDELFHSTHALDMTFSDVSESVTYHLGYRREELVGRSWYSLLHPEDADLAAAQHRAVALGRGPGGSPAVLRLLRRDRSWAWLRVWARRGRGLIACSSRSLREEEAAYLRDRPRGTGPAAPHSPALSRLAAQLRALADSLSPPSCAVPAPCPGVPGAPGGVPGACPDAALALARLLGDALEAVPPGTAHARPAPQ